MGAEEITFEELLAAEPPRLEAPISFKQLLAEGFPCHGGLERLAAIGQMPDPGPQFAEVRRRYLHVLEIQRKASKARS